MVHRNVAIGVSAGVGVLAIAVGLFFYSYSQIQFKLNDISFAGIDWDTSTPALFTAGVNLVIGDYVGAALSVINGVKLDLTFAATNHGFLPVYIPDLTYDLSINDISVGKGQGHVDVTINPGETKNLPLLQVIQKSSLTPAAASLIETGGIMNIKASGTANFKLLGLTIPVPFQSTKQISIVDEIQKRFSGSEPQEVASVSSPTVQRAYLSIRADSYSIYEGDSIEFSGRLTDANDNGLANRLVQIKQDKSLDFDPILASGYTDSAGYYDMTWTSDSTGSYRIYSTSLASADYSAGRSNTIVITVSQFQPAEEQEPEPEPTPAPEPQQFYITSLSIHVSPTTVTEGQIVSITGRITTTEGLAVQGAAISIKDEDLGSGDDLIITIYTDSDGYYSYDWPSRQYDPFDNVVEIYAVHEETSNTSSSRSDQINVTVN